MWIQSLGREDPLEEGMATDSNILAQRIPWTEKPVGYSTQGCKKSNMTEATEHTCTLEESLQRMRCLDSITTQCP